MDPLFIARLSFNLNNLIIDFGPHFRIPWLWTSARRTRRLLSLTGSDFFQKSSTPTFPVDADCANQPTWCVDATPFIYKTNDFIGEQRSLNIIASDHTAVLAAERRVRRLGRRVLTGCDGWKPSDNSKILILVRSVAFDVKPDDVKRWQTLNLFTSSAAVEAFGSSSSSRWRMMHRASREFILISLRRWKTRAALFGLIISLCILI